MLRLRKRKQKENIGPFKRLPKELKLKKVSGRNYLCLDSEEKFHNAIKAGKLFRAKMKNEDNKFSTVYVKLYPHGLPVAFEPKTGNLYDINDLGECYFARKISKDYNIPEIIKEMEKKAQKN
ncbi:MAG: hypothetical protein AB1467_00945 [Candidatus Diapherotrites archaeon]